MWLAGLVAPILVGSSWTRDLIHVPCTGRRILHDWTTREAPDWCLIKEKEKKRGRLRPRLTEVRRCCDDRGRTWNDTEGDEESQGLPRASGRWQRAEESSLPLTPCFGLLSFRTMRGYISVILSHPVHGHLSQQSRKTKAKPAWVT